MFRCTMFIIVQNLLLFAGLCTGVLSTIINIYSTDDCFSFCLLLAKRALNRLVYCSAIASSTASVTVALSIPSILSSLCVGI